MSVENITSKDELSGFKQLFPMRQFQMQTTVKEPIMMVTTGEAIANNILIVGSLIQNLLKSLEQHLQDSNDNERAHGLGCDIVQALVDKQDEVILLLDNCVDLSNKANDRSKPLLQMDE